MTEQQLDPKTAAFVEGLAKVLTDLEEVRRRDPEAVMLIGSLADRLCKDSDKSTWPEVKTGLSADEHKSLVGTFARQIESAHGEGKIKVAYALQALATSLIGQEFDEKGVADGVTLLDDFIASARIFFVQNAPKPN